MTLTDWLNQIAIQFGYLGVFLISLIGTMSIIFPIPYTLIILLLGVAGWDPLMLTISGGLGSAIGEIAGYFLGYYGRRIISSDRQRKMDYLLKILGKYTPIALFIFALTPLPDDLLFIPLGILRYNLLKAFIPSFLGKLLMCYILASFGGIYYDSLIFFFGETGSWIGSAVTGVLLVLVIYALYKIDWEKIFVKYVTNSEKQKK